MRFMNGVEAKLETHTYPATTSELIAAYGDHEFDLPNGRETFGEALGRLPEETFECPEDAQFSTYQAVSSKAIGRKFYSDRDAPSMGEGGPEQVSF